ncbi:unnamed protein product [Phytophthora fragariaefolia]|uniref:Unnamed protein product n=1 Tax=Phytophthora fragariaefolia TaxID=1490495 RepID=A0A9W6YN59_9STRA|nr:unnamed protein product [Phytophthora fragariaefolia]
MVLGCQARSTGVWRPVASQHGGARRDKIMPEHVGHMVMLLEDSCLLTLFDLMDDLQVTFGIEVAPQTVHNGLNAIRYTCKKTHDEPSEMNSPRVKANASPICDSERISSLADFQLVPQTAANATESVVSSQRTEMVPSSPALPVSSVATTGAFGSPLAASSQTSTIAPWTPRRGDQTPPLRAAHRVDFETVTTRTPGFDLVGDTALSSARDEWVPAVWTAPVVRITEQHHPRSQKFRRVPIEV